MYGSGAPAAGVESVVDQVAEHGRDVRREPLVQPRQQAAGLDLEDHPTLDGLRGPATSSAATAGSATRAVTPAVSSVWSAATCWM